MMKEGRKRGGGGVQEMMRVVFAEGWTMYEMKVILCCQLLPRLFQTLPRVSYHIFFLDTQNSMNNYTLSIEQNRAKKTTRNTSETKTKRI